MECIFCQIINKQIKSNPVFEDEKIIVIKDIHPRAPIHLLIIPKEHVRDFYMVEKNEVYLSAASALKKMIKEQGLDTKGYKIEINGGGAQIVHHLHFHLMGPLSPSRLM